MMMKTSENDSVKSDKKKKTLFKKIIVGHSDFTRDTLTRFSYQGLINPENVGFNAVDGYKYKQQFRFTYRSGKGGKIYSVIPQIGYAFNRKSVFWSVENQFRNILTKNNVFGFSFGKESRDFKPKEIEMNRELDDISTWFFAANFKRYYD